MNGGDQNGQLYFQGIILSRPAGSWVQNLTPWFYASPLPVLLSPGTPDGQTISNNLHAHYPPIHLPGWTLNPGPCCSTKTLCPPPSAPTEARSGRHLHPQGKGKSWPPPHNFPRTPSPHPHLRFPPQHGLPSLHAQPRSALGHVRVDHS